MRFQLHLFRTAGIVAAILVTTAAPQLLAQTASPPRPPSRPATRQPAQPQPPTQPRAPRPTVPSDDADLDPDHPPVLPPASRAKMHACGREWQEMKRRGADRNQTWRQFATACLQKDG